MDQNYEVLEDYKVSFALEIFERAFEIIFSEV